MSNRWLLGAGLTLIGFGFVFLAWLNVRSSWEAMNLNGVTAVNTSKEGRVAVAIDSACHVLAPDGSLMLSLPSNGDGQPFGSVTSLAFDDEESVYIGDSTRHRLDVFDKEGIFLRAHEGTELTGTGRFDALPLSAGGLVIVDSLGSRVFRLTPEGDVKDLSQGAIRNPQGIVQLPSGVLVTSEVNRERLRALDQDLKLLDELPAECALRGFEPRYEISHLHHSSSTAVSLASDCVNKAYDCYVELIEREGGSRPVATLSHIHSRSDDQISDESLVLGIASLPDGRVLVAGGRYPGLFSFSGVDGGPPGEMSDIPRVQWEGFDEHSVATMGDNNLMRLHGDAELLALMTSLAEKQRTFLSTATFARRANYGLLGLLIALYALARATGLLQERSVDEGPTRAVSSWSGLIFFDLKPVLVFLAIVGAGALVSAAFASVLPGVLALFVSGIAGGFLVSRLWGTRSLVRGRSPEHALRAAEHYFGPDALAAEALTRSAFRRAAYLRPRESAGQLEKKLADPLSILFPRLMLAAVSEDAVVFVPCSLFGAPLGRILRFSRKGGRDHIILRDGEVIIRSRGGDGQLRFETPPHAKRLLGTSESVSGTITWHCQQCGQLLADKPRNSCVHQRARHGMGLLLGALLPGLGHAYLGELRRARGIALVACVSAWGAAKWIIPWWNGTLQATVFRALFPLATFLLLWSGSLVDLWRLKRRDAAQRHQSRP